MVARATDEESVMMSDDQPKDNGFKKYFKSIFSFYRTPFVQFIYHQV